MFDFAGNAINSLVPEPSPGFYCIVAETCRLVGEQPRLLRRRSATSFKIGVTMSEICPRRAEALREVCRLASCPKRLSSYWMP